jgi:hypothetical protein
VVLHHVYRPTRRRYLWQRLLTLLQEVSVESD